MSSFRQILEQIRDLRLTGYDMPPMTQEQEAQLYESPVVITRQHVMNVLKRVKQERLSQDGLYNWVHFVWFSDFYTASDEDTECIASVMHVLEELEEEGELSSDDIDYCLDALEHNDVAESLFDEEL
jgi:hypothetical protein